MSQRDNPPPLRFLAAEAARLKQLYSYSVADRKFLVARKGARIIYFCDSHDIIAYINPEGRNSLEGFRTQVERIATPNSDDDLKLRSDQIISGLLFDPDGVVGLFPSHGKQMDHEVAYQGDQMLRNQGDLLKRARAEIERLGQTLKGHVLAAEEAGSREQVQAAFKVVRDGAPALVALLRNELDSPTKRLEAVLTDSCLVQWDALEWTDFGAQGDDRPADRAPSLTEVTAMQGELAARHYRRNSDDSNWTDASALAHLASLNAEVSRRTNRLTQVCLVSRAWTLLQSAIDLAEANLPVLVRHPRLLALRATEAEQLDRAEQLTLDTALEIYRAHLATLKNAQEADGMAAHSAASAFVESWDGFEKSRLALEAKPLLTSHPGDHDVFGQLVRIFKSADRPEVELNRIFLASFAKFGAAAAEFLLNKNDLRQTARVDRMEDSPQVQVTPLTTCSVGPLKLSAWDAMPANGGRATLQDIASAVESRSRAERFLVWSLALASARRWKQAGLFALAARQVADLEAETEGRAIEIRNEATLLRVEIRRLGARADTDPDDGVSDPTRRYNLAMDDLKKLGDWHPPRVACEEAMQRVEAFLLGVRLSEPPDLLRSLAVRLSRHVMATKSRLNKTRLIAVQLVMHLAAERHGAFWPDRSSSDKDEAQTLHRQLVKLLTKLRDDGIADGLPHRVRAVALIGFKQFRRPEPASVEDTGRALTEVKDIEVPEAMRGDLSLVERALQDGSDEVARLLLREIGPLAASFRLLNEPKLVLAPVRFRAVEERLHELGGEFGRKADEAYQMAAPVMEAYLGAGLEGRHIDQLERSVTAFDDLIEAAPAALPDKWLLFHLLGERLLLRLLVATHEPEHDQKSALQALDEEYKQLSVAFPGASLPYIRRHHIAYVQGHAAKAVELLETAFTFVDFDPYLYPPGSSRQFHWLQSFVRRRLIALTLPEAAVERSGQNSVESARLQVEPLARAVKWLMEVDGRDDSDDKHKAHATEKERRTNNIVFYASRMLERNGGAALAELANEADLEALVTHLAPNGIDQVTDSDVLHTLGCYFAARRRPVDASQVGRRILVQISKRLADGVITKSDSVMHGEAIEWVQAESAGSVVGSEPKSTNDIRATSIVP